MTVPSLLSGMFIVTSLCNHNTAAHSLPHLHEAARFHTATTRSRTQRCARHRMRCGAVPRGPRLRTKFGERAFSHAGPATWNALPDHIRTVADPVKFRKLLKSHYFSQAFNIR